MSAVSLCALSKLLLFLHDILWEEVPKIEADFEEFLIRDPAHLRQIVQATKCWVTQEYDMLIWFDDICQVLNKGQMIPQNRWNGKG